MKHSSANKFFRDMACAYDRADIDAIAACYDLPCAVYVDDRMVVFSDREVLKDALRTQCGKAVAKGACRVSNRVVAESLRQSRHLSAWVEWRHLDAAGAHLFTTSARYFCRVHDNGPPTIGLVELTESPVSYSAEDLEWMSRRRFANP